LPVEVCVCVMERQREKVVGSVVLHSVPLSVSKATITAVYLVAWVTSVRKGETILQR
jgi:hypothetical protein